MPELSHTQAEEHQGRIPAIQEAIIKTKNYHPAHLEAANVMSCLEKTMTTSNSSDSCFCQTWSQFCTSLSSLHTEQVLLSGGSLTPAHFHILQTWLCLSLELFPATFFLRGSSATLRMLHLKTDASSCQQMQNGSSPCSVICPHSAFSISGYLQYFNQDLWDPCARYGPNFYGKFLVVIIT